LNALEFKNLRGKSAEVRLEPRSYRYDLQIIGVDHGAYRDVSAVIAEMLDGTNPLKRFLERALCHDAPSHAIESALALHSWRGRTGRPAW
jgi:hypothetical protein